MPITLPPISRRRFLGGTLAAGIGVMAGVPWLRGAETAETDHIALLSDPHIAADRAAVLRETCMAKNLEKVCAEVVALKGRPAFAIVNGDCALLTGEAGDYATFLELIKPMREAGMPVHLTLGNHDNRERFWEGLGSTGPEAAKKVVEDRHVSIVEAPRANWFLLDSLMETNKTVGLLGEKQIEWLGRALDARAQKPAIIVGHHNWGGEGHPNGLTDGAALFEVLKPRKHVKAFIFGHTHDWWIGSQDGVHLVNLPPVAYTFKPGPPNGWVDAFVTDHGMKLELRSLDAVHIKSGQKVELSW